eukprot:gene1519-12625_t
MCKCLLPFAKRKMSIGHQLRTENVQEFLIEFSFMTKTANSDASLMCVEH